MNLHITNETSRLRAVVLGTAKSNGPIPTLEEAYDPKSKEHIQAGTYPAEEDMVNEIESVAAVLEKYEVQVFRPKIIENYNQIFTRDIAFVIDDKLVKSNILPDRDQEIEAIDHVIRQIDPEKIIRLPEEAHIEGGDVMPMGDYIFVGTYKGKDYKDFITARTNIQAVEALKEIFPNKTVKSFSLKKSNSIARDNALHLDCCFQPVGKNKAIIYKEGFLIEEELNWLIDFFGKEHIYEITRDEMYHMNSNIFSISEDVVISEKNFTRLNSWLRDQVMTVEEVPYAEISKQEGLLRCSTLPLIRD
ncbi:dimethylarginine dimethylaminohydrolase family protein [Christiangramia flava]|uniref:arginine deiminase n=1 Tax=Christiangramia flava JLT2011 TaxID=1229726 RepID=A0A1L7I1J4_9FLAO|nr:arginine deiminase family protein [Christiangramia flava]APU67489.1 NG,NG-dimethylarginine dimethylaminohydrolase 1 [Christiangramia flava JLT2011]OSS40075.1 NG,NG-dimethylarginine dimethylaminohydrolase 1 [Christiangramia flava JLT2011]